MANSKTKSKAERVRSMLSRKNGVSLDEICKATNWKPHSARAFLSGLRKRGFVIEREQDEAKISRYKVTAEPGTQS